MGSSYIALDERADQANRPQKTKKRRPPAPLTVVFKAIYGLMLCWMLLCSGFRLFIMFSLGQPVDPLPYVGMAIGTVALLAVIMGRGGY